MRWWPCQTSQPPKRRRLSSALRLSFASPPSCISQTSLAIFIFFLHLSTQLPSPKSLALFLRSKSLHASLSIKVSTFIWSDACFWIYDDESNQAPVAVQENGSVKTKKECYGVFCLTYDLKAVIFTFSLFCKVSTFATVCSLILSYQNVCVCRKRRRNHGRRWSISQFQVLQAWFQTTFSSK